MSLISLALLTSKRGGPITVFYCQSSTSMEIRAALLAERRNSSLTDRRKGRRGRTEISAGIRCCISCMLCLFILKKKTRCFQGQDNNGDRSRSCISGDPAPNRWRFRNKCHIAFILFLNKSRPVWSYIYRALTQVSNKITVYLYKTYGYLHLESIEVLLSTTHLQLICFSITKHWCYIW